MVPLPPWAKELAARRRVLERNRRKAAALNAEMAAKFPAKTAEPARRGRRALQGPETCPLIRLAFGQPPIPIPSLAMPDIILTLLAFGHFPLTGGIGPLTREAGPQGEG